MVLALRMPQGRIGPKEALMIRSTFMTTQSKDDAPAFFGQDTRYGHRVYGAVIINAVR